MNFKCENCQKWLDENKEELSKEFLSYIQSQVKQKIHSVKIIGIRMRVSSTHPEYAIVARYDGHISKYRIAYHPGLIDNDFDDPELFKAWLDNGKRSIMRFLQREWKNKKI